MWWSKQTKNIFIKSTNLFLNSVIINNLGPILKCSNSVQKLNLKDFFNYYYIFNWSFNIENIFINLNNN